MAKAQVSTLHQNSSLFFKSRVWLFSALCFVLPFRASYIYSISALLLLVWILEGNIRIKTRDILSSKLCLAFLAYFLAFLFAMLWTEDKTAGWKMVARQIPMLLFPLYWSSAEFERKERYISLFLAGLCVCALLAYYNLLRSKWFPEWPRGIQVNKSVGDTAPFVDWIMYSPLLALGSYFSLQRAVHDASVPYRALHVATFCLLVSNLVFSGGRAGMVMFAALCIVLAFERIKSRFKAAMFCLVLLPIGFALAYGSLGFFAERVDKAISDIRELERNSHTSVGLRLTFWKNGLLIFSEHPLIGVGSGDFSVEYERIKTARASTINPHNQFIMTAATTGLLGLIPLLFIFYFAANECTDPRMRALLVGYVTVCLFESYLWRSNTALAFAVLISALTAARHQRIQNQQMQSKNTSVIISV